MAKDGVRQDGNECNVRTVQQPREEMPEYLVTTEKDQRK